ncbi:MAG: hypothetical protein ACP5O7_11675 [Phycisphaerae bacterium]
MARISTEELEKLKRQVSLVDLCRHYGIELKAIMVARTATNKIGKSRQ